MWALDMHTKECSYAYITEPWIFYLISTISVATNSPYEPYLRIYTSKKLNWYVMYQINEKNKSYQNQSHAILESLLFLSLYEIYLNLSKNYHSYLFSLLCYWQRKKTMWIVQFSIIIKLPCMFKWFFFFAIM